MEHDSSTRTDERRGRRQTGRGEPRRRVRRASTSPRRRRSGSATTAVRDVRSTGRYRHEDAIRRARGDSASAHDPRGFGGLDPSRGLAWFFGVFTCRGRASLTASGLLWLFVYVGWRGGLLDVDAVLWLAAGVVLASHILAVGQYPDGGTGESGGTGRPGRGPTATPTRAGRSCRRRRVRSRSGCSVPAWAGGTSAAPEA